MSRGIKIWNAAGQVIVDVSDRLAYHHSTINLWNIGTRASSTISIPGYSTDGTWFLFFRGTPTDYLRFTEQASQILVFNEDYYYARGAGVIIEVFRG